MAIEHYHIPAPLVTAIDGAIDAGHLDGADRGRAVMVCNAMYRKFMVGFRPLSEFKPFARNYWVKILGSLKHYHVVTALKQAGIIETLWHTDKETGERYFYLAPWQTAPGKSGRCGLYRFNPEVLEGPLQAVELKVRRRRNPKGSKEAADLIRQAREMLLQIELPFDTEGNPQALEDFLKHYTQSQQFIEHLQKRGRVSFPDHADHAIMLLASGESEKVDGAILEAYRRAGLELIQYQPKDKNEPARIYLAKWEDFARHIFGRSFEWMLATINNPLASAQTVGRNVTNQRLQSILAQLFSEFLGLITVRGEHLAGADLKNSQFVILAAIIEQTIQDYLNIFSYREKTKYSVKKSAAGIAQVKANRRNEEKKGNPYQITQTKGKLTYIKPLSCYLKAYLEGANEPNPPENQEIAGVRKMGKISALLDFAELAQSGNFYEAIADKLFPHQPDRKAARSKTKEALFEVVFDKYNRGKDYKEQLRELFPELVEFIDYAKKRAYEDYKREYKADPRAFKFEHAEAIERLTNKLEAIQPKGDPQGPAKAPTMAQILFQMGNNLFAITLQRIEARIFIDGAMRKLLRRGIWVASKHDSLLCLHGDYKKVRRTLRAELDKWLGPGKYKLEGEKYHLTEDGLPTKTKMK